MRWKAFFALNNIANNGIDTDIALFKTEKYPASTAVKELLEFEKVYRHIK